MTQAPAASDRVGAPVRTKGPRTREAILEAAMGLACRVGLAGLTIGAVAGATGLSKSGVYAHVGSKEGLQLAVLDAAARQFGDVVVVPALAAPRGRPRVEALLDHWLRCGRERRPGGVVFVKAGMELDDQPGPVRDHLRALHADLARTIARVVGGGIVEGHVRPDADVDQFAADLYGVMLRYYQASRLLEDPLAEQRARASVAALLDALAPFSPRDALPPRDPGGPGGPFVPLPPIAPPTADGTPETP